MKISLITICWNSERTLSRSLKSVSEQTRRPDEYVFVDGGSTDRTLEILEDFKAKMEHSNMAVRILAQERHENAAGIPDAWNQGISDVTGDVIGMLNSDDWYESTALESVETVLEAHPKCGAVSCPTRFVNEYGREEKVFYPKCLCVFLPFMMPVPHPGLFVRRTTYDTVGKYNVNYKISADYDWIWRFYKAGQTLAYVKDPQVNMELGGLANSNRNLARNETLEIASLHGARRLARMAWLLRKATGR